MDIYWLSCNSFVLISLREQTLIKKELAKYSRLQLAQLGREYMLCAQFNSRTGYAALRINHGDEAYKEVAIANWMGASPVYTRRMQKAMGFAGGTDVATIFKGLQLECVLHISISMCTLKCHLPIVAASGLTAVAHYWKLNRAARTR